MFLPHDMHCPPRHGSVTSRHGIRGRLLGASALLALLAYLAGSTGPVIVHGVHLLHHALVLHEHLHIGEADHQKAQRRPHSTDDEIGHTHGALIDHALIWSNVDAEEERSAHTLQESRFSLHLPLIPFTPQDLLRHLHPALFKNEHPGGRLRPEPLTPPPRCSPAQDHLT